MHSIKEKKNDYLLYFLAFIVPTLIFLIYFICRKMDILTVDLGQQYIDFIAYFKNNLFKNPLSLIYNFNQGLGDSFIATVAYYLTSPLNLTLFFIPTNFLPQAILIIISLKIGLIGLTSYYLWQKNFQRDKKILALTASLAFALSGYVVCYNLNLMWLDSLILLPLLVDAINQIFSKQPNYIYLCIITFVLWFTNFYTGFMSLFFGFLYFICQLSLHKCKKPAIKTYFGASILGSLLDAALLLPTFFELLAGKAHSNTQWDLNWQLMPFDVLNKLVTGSFSFHEMSDGWPNIYFTISFLLLSLLYFTSQNFSWRQKLANGLLLIFLFISLSFNPLVLLWHMGQYPVWYPARSSFIFIFYSLNLAVCFLTKQDKLNWQQIFFSLLIGISLVIFWISGLKHIAFLSSTKIMISTVFIICNLLLFIFFNKKYATLLFYALVGLEVSINLVLSLDNISYQKNSTYITYTQKINSLTDQIKKKDNSFYRIEKNFNHTDNDPFSDNYYGISNFNSISNSRVITFVNSLGLKNNDNSYSYQYSDLLTDSLLGIKYLIISDDGQQNEFNEHYDRIDLKNDRPTNTDSLHVIKNKLAFPIIMQTSNKVNPSLTSTAINNQTNLFNSLTDNHSSLFQPIFWPVAKLKNVKQEGATYRKINKNQPASISFDFIPDTNQTYYLELSPDLVSSTASLSINHTNVDTEDLGSSSKLFPIAKNDRHKIIRITFDLYDYEINLGASHLYRFNDAAYRTRAKKFIDRQAMTFQTSTLSLHYHTNLSTSKYIYTTIPYSRNWLIFDNGHLIKNKIWLKAFVSFKLKRGNHRIKLIYIPFGLIIGTLISLTSLIILLVTKKRLAY